MCWNSSPPHSSGDSDCSHLPLPVSIINPILWQFPFQKIFSKLLHAALAFRSVLLPALFQMVIHSALAGSSVQRIARQRQLVLQGGSGSPKSSAFTMLTILLLHWRRVYSSTTLGCHTSFLMNEIKLISEAQSTLYTKTARAPAVIMKWWWCKILFPPPKYYVT